MDQTLKQDIFLLIATVIICLFGGAILFSYVEGWSVFDSLYFVTMTATTVGYGDFTPTTHLGKFLTMLFALSIIPFVLYTFSFVAKAQMNKVYRKVHHLEKLQAEQEEELDETEEVLKLQKAELKRQQEALEKEKKELEEESKVNDEQDREIDEHDKRLNAVEAISGKR